MEKLHSYQGWSGRVHEVRDGIKSKISTWKESHEGENIVDMTKNYARKISTGKSDKGRDDFSHIYRLANSTEIICIPGGGH
jgi:solute carrier family 45 protein 1/2/4